MVKTEKVAAGCVDRCGLSLRHFATSTAGSAI